jgi:hypothetical protein
MRCKRSLPRLMRRCRQRQRQGGRATQTEQGREAERTRADALRDKFEELQVRLAEVETEGDGLTLERMRSPYARLA